jgi:hypothetical protein
MKKLFFYWQKVLPLWVRCVILAMMGILAIFLFERSLDALWGALFSVLALFEKPKRPVLNERDEADKKKRAIDDDVQRNIRDIQIDDSLGEALEQERQRERDRQLEREAADDTSQEKKKKLFRDVDEILGDK